MELSVSNGPLAPNALQNTAFTSILMGVFLNSPLISSYDLSGLSGSVIFQRYGQPFLNALEDFSGLNTLAQFEIIHSLQK